MTRDSDGGRPQKTVAELLAEHGGQVGGNPRRRRRRAAEDDDAPGGRTPRMGDTAPQAIIDRVRSEGPQPPRTRHNGHAAPEANEEPPPGRGGPRPGPPQAPPPQAPRQGQQPQPPKPRQQQSGPLPRPQHPTGGYPVPGAEEVGRPPLPPRAPNGRPPQGGVQTNGAVKPPLNGAPHGHTGPNGVPNGVKPPGDAQGRMNSTRRVQPAPPPAGQPPSSAQDGSLAARLDGLGEAEADVAEPKGPPPPAPHGTGAYPAPPHRRRPPRLPPAPPPEPSTEQFPAVDETAIAQALPGAAAEPPAGLSGWHGQRQGGFDDTEIAVLPTLPQEGDDEAEEGPPTGYYVPEFDDDDDASQPYRSGVLDDDPLGEADDYRDYDDDSGEFTYDESEEAGEAAQETASPARQWLALAGQLALGVVGGAGVWLGFNWLWVALPAAALVAALVVTVGLVWIVRKVRRAEDLQTTVLALLVGLVVTVSPAALLLLSR
ncbi:hypothetical protein [Saccharomonospora marina]|uniref:hypothetical protein n=1 Tax=Saccharomonospora marina TaxID=632569 RepID=UPI0002D9A8C3|nr:hypothetical protein [Saccharomonospora marina]